MNREEVNKILSLLQNPTRRKILEILAQEEHYPLQISRALNTSQQSVSKHLKTMESQGIVVSRASKSERGGPPTKTYTLNSEFTVRIDLGPSLFETEIEELEDEPVEGYEELEDKVENKDKEDFLERQRQIVQEIEEEINKLERKRCHLMKLKERTLEQAYKHIYDNFQDYRQRSLLYYIINSGTVDPEKIASDLGAREDEVRSLIETMKDKTNLW